MDAESKCVSEGGHLTSIHGAQEKEFIDTLAIDVESTCYWIGLYNIFQDFVTWGWNDGAEFQYDSWAAAHIFTLNRPTYSPL
uniref:C-type lectin domain-containing protein n=1 Tax=Acrobeloides nanus TaxID=290746 RepID=A0A914E2L2_9BILA